jgi:hypothetical protein
VLTLDHELSAGVFVYFFTDRWRRHGLDDDDLATVRFRSRRKIADSANPCSALKMPGNNKPFKSSKSTGVCHCFEAFFPGLTAQAPADPFRVFRGVRLP